ncbi:MAG: molybdopterin-dependent oxidoreductase, partial [Bdellovibrionota bacterium]
PYCGVGCELEAGVAQDKIIGIKPSIEGPSNKGHLCAKGRYAFSYVDADDRVTTPMVRVGGRWKKTGWDEALNVAADSLKKIIKSHGGDSIGVMASARATNEDSFLAQKFARVVLGTNNVDCCARVCHAPTAAGMSRVFGTGVATNSFNDIEKAGLIFILGANPTENHPVIGARIKQQVLRGVPLIVADPRRTELAKLARIHLALKPGTNVPLLHALAQVIITEKLCDVKFIEARTEGYLEFKSKISPFTPERAAEISGVPPDLIRQAARLYAQTAPAMCIHGLGITENIQGTESVMAISHLALLTGNIGKAGSGVNPLRGQNNVQGTAAMGCEPNRLVGSQKYNAVSKNHEEIWKTEIPTVRGQTVLEMVDSAGQGTLHGMLMIGYDVFFSSPHANEVEN